jgi:hypothetical protein
MNRFITVITPLQIKKKTGNTGYEPLFPGLEKQMHRAAM